jgi:hypothetical protein
VTDPCGHCDRSLWAQVMVTVVHSVDHTRKSVNSESLAEVGRVRDG